MNFWIFLQKNTEISYISVRELCFKVLFNVIE